MSGPASEVRFGIVAPKGGTKATLGNKFAERLSTAAHLPVTSVFADSYDALAAMLSNGMVTVAWLPPIPFIALERAKIAIPLVDHHRGGHARFDAVLIVRKDSTDRTLYALRGKRAACPRRDLALDDLRARRQRRYGSGQDRRQLRVVPRCAGARSSPT